MYIVEWFNWKKSLVIVSIRKWGSFYIVKWNVKCLGVCFWLFFLFVSNLLLFIGFIIGLYKRLSKLFMIKVFVIVCSVFF